MPLADDTAGGQPGRSGSPTTTPCSRHGALPGGSG